MSEKVNRRDLQNKILRDLVNFYKEPTILLVNHLRNKHGYTDQMVADVLDVSRPAVQANYPRRSK